MNVQGAQENNYSGTAKTAKTGDEYGNYNKTIG